MTDYTSLTPELIAELKRAVQPADVLVGSEIGEDYSHDELASVRVHPEALVFATSAEQVSAVMRFANAHHVPVTPRGQGTGLVGGAVPVHGGILLDLSRMNRILGLDENNLHLTVDPGVLLMDIYAYTDKLGLYYPPNPGEKSASIGGNVATNAGGMSAVKYGVTRDYVRAIEVVLPDGKIVHMGGGIVKNSSGYSMKDLMIGSEGTLGVITKITLKLLPAPAFAKSMLVPFPSLESAVGAVPALLNSHALPRSLEFMEQEVIQAAEDYLGRKFPDKSAPAYLMLTFDGNSRDEVQRQFDEAAEICLSHSALDALIADSDERQEVIWTPRGAFLEAIKASTTEMDECDVVVPRDKIAEFIRFTMRVQDEEQIRIKNFGHAGDGNVHVYVLRDELGEAEWEAKLTKVFDRLYSHAHELGGKVSGEHGIGYAKRDFLAESEDDGVMALMRGIKQVFDPNNILNPGKVV